MAQPKEDEVEVSLFGPGYGECAVVHLYAGEWLVIDSCYGEDRKTPVALNYLQNIGVDVEQAVKWVIATHWHDDHIKGLAQVVNKATSAKFACSTALKCQEFCTLIATMDNFSLVEESSGINELSEILEIKDRGPDQWLSENSCFFRKSLSDSTIEGHALSPAAATITNGHREIASMIAKQKNGIKRLPSTNPNHLSVVIQLVFPNFAVLLGGDLQKDTQPDQGWNAVLKLERPQNWQSDCYKIPHHGSHNGHDDRIWNEMLYPSPLSMLTPWVRGSKDLPTKDDVQRIKAKTDKLFTTVWPPRVSARRKMPAIDREMKAIAGKKQSALRNKPGHIRARRKINGESEWEIQLLDGARAL
ncbi:MAG: MBL fold metallo-hydrolase [Planctomycetota bacterium]